VPLIVPEVNPEAIFDYSKKNIIANPNCSTAQMVVALKPLHDKARIKRVVVSTYSQYLVLGKMLSMNSGIKQKGFMCQAKKLSQRYIQNKLRLM
jgi:aspartate-semialdehyde dehydrogenase